MVLLLILLLLQLMIYNFLEWPPCMGVLWPVRLWSEHTSWWSRVVVGHICLIMNPNFTCKSQHMNMYKSFYLLILTAHNLPCTTTMNETYGSCWLPLQLQPPVVLPLFCCSFVFVHVVWTRWTYRSHSCEFLACLYQATLISQSFHMKKSTSTH